LNVAFVRGLQEYRMFAKATWQATTNHRLAFSVNYDPQEYLNEGLSSFTQEEAGYTLKAGGTVLALRDTAVLSPMVALETTLSSFDGRPALEPNLARDTNDNGLLYYDRNDNGVMEATERDPGEDVDGDGVFDVVEPFVRFGLSPSTDRDGDGHRTPFFGCEGLLREDKDCDGHLDRIAEVDLNGDGFLNNNEDLDDDFRWDDGTEDRNQNGKLDDTPRPTSLYPYGELSPERPDLDYDVSATNGVISGPYYKEESDRRQRLGLRQDLSVYVAGSHGSHDIKTGWIAEREQFERTATPGMITSLPETIWCDVGVDRRCRNAQLRANATSVRILLPTETTVQNEATGVGTGIYVQDNFKPVPSLNIAVGLRFDREKAESFGYTSFDPAPERALFDRLRALSGAEVGHEDFQQGNNDGLNNFGFLRDPMFYVLGDARQNTAFISDPLRIAAISRLTRHHSLNDFQSQTLGGLFSELFENGVLNQERLIALGVNPQMREKFAITNNNLAPRLSVSWDPWQDGKTKLFGTWGRYYDRLFLNTVIGEEGPDYLGRYYEFNHDGLTLQRLGSSFITVGATPNRHIGKARSRAAPSATQVDRSLRTPFSDEWTLGFQREISPEVALSVTYIDRKYRDQLQDIDINHTLRYDPVTGEPFDRDGILLTNPSGGGGGGTLQVGDGRPDLYLLNPFFNQILRIGNYNESFYHGVELMILRRLSRRWQLQGSYTYSRAMGEAEDFQSRLGNDPSTVESEFGYLDYDQRHVVKLHMMTYLPHDWQVGSAVTWASGLPYSIISRFFALDNEKYLQLRTRFGYTAFDNNNAARFVSVSRNSERNDATLDLNLSLRKTFVMGKTTAAGFLEVFNVLNSGDLRIYSYEPSKGDITQLDAALLDSVAPVTVDGERRFGRRFQVGMQFQF
jgi:hypothetical protein